MSRRISNKIALRAIVLLTVSSCLYFVIVDYMKSTWYWPQSVTRQEILCSKLKLSLQNKLTYGDLSEEFKVHEGASRMSTDVFKAIKSDGYTLLALSINMLGQNIREQTESIATENLNAFSSVLDNATDNKVDLSAGEATSMTFLQVPNVVHYIVFGKDVAFTFTNFLSYLSVDRFIQPEQIFVHGDNIPSGPWWNLTIHNVRNIYHVNTMYSDSAPNGKAFKYPAHISDYLRTEILLRYGGIYLDADVLVLKSFAPLRQYSVTMGQESPLGVCNGIILAERGAPFLRLLREQYHSYAGKTEAWAIKSVYNTHLLAVLYPHLIHIESLTLNRPNYKEIVLLYDGWYNWTQNYALHLWMRLWPQQKRPNGFKDVLMQNTTFAEVARLIAFGSHECRPMNVTKETDFIYSELSNPSETTFKDKTGQID